MIARAEAAVQRKLRGTAFSFVGILFILVGLGFLSAAVWIVLAEMRSPLFAATVIGGGLTGLGLIFLGIAKAVSTPPKAPEKKLGTKDTSDIPLAELVEGFLIGLEAGRKSRR